MKRVIEGKVQGRSDGGTRKNE